MKLQAAGGSISASAHDDPSKAQTGSRVRIVFCGKVQTMLTVLTGLPRRPDSAAHLVRLLHVCLPPLPRPHVQA